MLTNKNVENNVKHSELHDMFDDAANVFVVTGSSNSPLVVRFTAEESQATKPAQRQVSYNIHLITLSCPWPNLTLTVRESGLKCLVLIHLFVPCS